MRTSHGRRRQEAHRNQLWHIRTISLLRGERWIEDRIVKRATASLLISSLQREDFQRAPLMCIHLRRQIAMTGSWFQKSEHHLTPLKHSETQNSLQWDKLCGEPVSVFWIIHTLKIKKKQINFCLNYFQIWIQFHVSVKCFLIQTPCPCDE